MESTYFQTFIDAFSALDERSRVLDGDMIVCPPSSSSDYQSTPRNALTFAKMGVDGVHSAILTINGHVRDGSPVVYVSPMDSNDVMVLAESFLLFLANGCGQSTVRIQTICNAERAGERQLVTFLSKHFDRSRLLGEERTEPLTLRYGHLIERKLDSPNRE